MLKTIVKVSQVSNLSDARYCAGMGVEYIGFSMDEVPFEQYKEMRGWLAGVQIVGETDTKDISQILDLVETFQPDLVQVSAQNLPDLEQLQRVGLPIILKTDFATANLPALFQTTAGYVEYFLLENTDEFAQLDDAALSQIDAWAFQYPILLAFGIKEDSIGQLIDDIPVKGIALKGGQEIRPGFADMDELMNILEAIESED
ncbi:hypothetical protein [Flectobacillus major]|uniref:phosphoribosylanthranilate isomerase n=1 Tax=Flectobacillus major TaxID=103 RepID=UPI00041726D6|nr:hypothetical protein [Flectobacillus major]